MLSIGGDRPELLPFISVPLTLIWSCKLLGYAMDVATGELIEEGEHWGLARGTYARTYICICICTHTYSHSQHANTGPPSTPKNAHVNNRSIYLHGNYFFTGFAVQRMQRNSNSGNLFL